MEDVLQDQVFSQLSLALTLTFVLDAQQIGCILECYLKIWLDVKNYSE